MPKHARPIPYQIEGHIEKGSLRGPRNAGNNAVSAIHSRPVGVFPALVSYRICRSLDWYHDRRCLIRSVWWLR